MIFEAEQPGSVTVHVHVHDKSLKKIRPARIVLYCVMIGIVLFTALPLIYMISTAFKPMQELFFVPAGVFCAKSYDKKLL